MTNLKNKAIRKKRIHLNRKNKKRHNFVGRIIADTNIWYQLGKDDSLFNNVKPKLTPVYNNLWEMSNTGMLHNNVKRLMVRNGIRKMMICKGRMILMEPIRYLTALNNKKYKKQIRPYTNDLLEFLQKISQDYYIDDSQQENFEIYINKTKANLYIIQRSINKMAAECKQKIKNIQKHRTYTDYSSTMELLDHMVRVATHYSFNLKKARYRDYELLVHVMDCFFKKLETGEVKFQRNDLFDLFILTYVRRGDKYWTNEKRWIKIIKDAGCQEYLYT